MFKNAAAAKKAVEKYNGAPIDGGASKLRLELIVDPTKRPLAARIVANALEQSKKAAKGKQPAKGVQAKAKQPAKPQQPKKEQPKKEKKKRPAKKTLEELDQEMTDYFEEQK